MSSLSGSQDLISQLNIQDFVNLSAQLLQIRSMKLFSSLCNRSDPECSPVTDKVPSVFVSDPNVLNELRYLTCNKTTGSDGIPNWLLKEYADILSYPIT